MIYTIAETKEVHAGFSVSYGKEGNRYTVDIYQLHEEGENEFKSKTYDNAADAKEAFMRISLCVLEGTYNFNDRAAML